MSNELKFTYAALEWLEESGLSMMSDDPNSLSSFTAIRKMAQAALIGGGKPDTTKEQAQAWIEARGIDLATREITKAFERDIGAVIKSSR